MSNDPIKIVFVGDSSTGKTSILTWYINGSPAKATKATIAAAFFTREVQVNEKNYEIVLWDTAGQEAFRGLVPMYYRGAAIAFIVFDVTSNDSFKNLSQWIIDVRSEAGDGVLIRIVGNKIDRKEDRVITFDAAKEFAESEHAKYCESSAVTGEGIEKMILDAVEDFVPLMKSEEESQQEVVMLSSDSNKSEKKGCC